MHPPKSKHRPNAELQCEDCKMVIQSADFYAIECTNCNLWWCPICTKLSINEFTKLKKSKNATFQCHLCEEGRGKDKNKEHPQKNKKELASEISTILDKKFEKISNKFGIFQKSIDSLSRKLDDFLVGSKKTNDEMENIKIDNISIREEFVVQLSEMKALVQRPVETLKDEAAVVPNSNLNREKTKKNNTQKNQIKNNSTNTREMQTDVTSEAGKTPVVTPQNPKIDTDTLPEGKETLKATETPVVAHKSPKIRDKTPPQTKETSKAEKKPMEAPKNLKIETSTLLGGNEKLNAKKITAEAPKNPTTGKIEEKQLSGNVLAPKNPVEISKVKKMLVAAFKNPENGKNFWECPERKVKKWTGLRKFWIKNNSDSYLADLINFSQLHPTTNPDTSLTFAKGKNYLLSVHKLMDMFTRGNDVIGDVDIEVVYESMIRLGYYPIDQDLRRTNQKFYCQLLKSKNMECVRTFIEIASMSIGAALKRFWAKFDTLPPVIKLLKAIQGSDVRGVSKCIADGVYLNYCDSDGRSPLHYAIYKGNLEIIEILINTRCIGYATTNKGNTPLHTAVAKGNVEIVKILLKDLRQGMNILTKFVNQQTTVGGNTALHVAAKNGALEITKILIKCGAMFCMKNSDGKTPFDLASDENVRQLLKLADELHVSAKTREMKILKKLETLRADDLETLVTDSLIATSATNGNYQFGSKLIEIQREFPTVKRPIPESLELKFVNLQFFAAKYLLHTDIIVGILRQCPLPHRDICVKEGSYLLLNLFDLIALYSEYNLGKDMIGIKPIDDVIKSLHSLLDQLQFKPQHIATEFWNGKNSFASEGIGTVYCDLLTRNVGSFITVVVENIGPAVCKFFHLMK